MQNDEKFRLGSSPSQEKKYGETDLEWNICSSQASLRRKKQTVNFSVLTIVDPKSVSGIYYTCLYVHIHTCLDR